MTARGLLVGVAAGAIALCAANSASACMKNSHPLLDDNFKNADPGWGQPDNIAAFTANGLVLKPPPGGSAWRSNPNFSTAHADWCVQIVNPSQLPTPADEDSVGSVGVWFWGKDLQNFYTATITLDGKAEIDRLNRGIWQTVVPPAAVAAIKTAPNAANELEIVTNGATAQFYVNGALVTQITGSPPANGAPGVYAESGHEVTTWQFPRVTLYPP